MSKQVLRPAASAADSDRMHYTRLGSSGLKISKVLLGAMSYGDMEKWMLPEEEALPLLKYAFDKGINTWETSDVYSLGGSERIISKALTEYNIPRERVVIMSKCYGGVPSPDEDFAHLSEREQLRALAVNDGVMVNRVGLSRKHILDAVRASVDRLGTYLDVLHIHRLDRETPREEIMKALNDVVEAGLIRYIGASSMYAWEFQALNNIADTHGWHKFISMESHYSLLHREEEREMHTYCRDTGIGLIPWSPLARGLLARPYRPDGENQTVRQQTDKYAAMAIGPVTEADVAIIGRVESLAKEKKCTMAQVGIMWCLKKGVNPIVGLSTAERVGEAAGAVSMFEKGLLTSEDVAYLEELYVAKPHLANGW